MDPDLIALLARLAELTPEELADLDARLVAYFAEQDEAGPGEDMSDAEHAELLEQIAEGRQAVRGEVTSREEAATAAEAQAEADRVAAEERRERARLLLNPPVEEVTPEEGTPAAEVTPEAEPVAAAATRTATVRRAGALGAMGTHRPAAAAPAPAQPTGPRVTTALVAAADVKGFSAGVELTSFGQVGKALSAKLDGLGRSAGADDAVTVATFRREYPAERTLVADAAEANLATIEQTFAAPTVTALTAAAGGLCAPLPVDYTIPEIGDLTRPFRDSKTAFQADRGGITTNVQPTLTAADAGIGFWTIANDANPGFLDTAGPAVPVGERLATKPVVEFDCGTSRTSYVYAVTLRTRYSNIKARFNPEVVAANARSGLVSHARLAELRLMALQVGFSTAVTSAQVLGASKDLFRTVDGVTARMRYRQRRARNTALRATMPAWVLDMIRADFVAQMPAHQSPAEQYAVADAAIQGWFAARNVNVAWMSEDLDGQAGGGIGAPQNAGALLDFPDTFRWFLEYEGDVLFLDGGELDLGVVRDSALNAKNRYETFFETFEGLHFRGAEAPLVITSTVNPNGAAQGLVDAATVDS